MICDRCDKPIKKGEAKVIPIDSPSGAVPDVYLHPYPCQPTPPRQTAPAGRW